MFGKTVISSKSSRPCYWPANDHSQKITDIYIHDIGSLIFYFFVCRPTSRPSVCPSVHVLRASVFGQRKLPVHILFEFGIA